MYTSNDNQINEKNSILNGVASTIVMNATNNYFALFAISVIGVSNYQVGLISSLPQFIGMFAMVLGSIIMNRLSEKKRFTAYSILFTRLFLIAIFFVMFIPAEYRAWVFVILVGLMNLPGSFANLSWQSLIGDLIPDQRRSGFFSERNRILTIVGMITTFLVGFILQQFDKNDAFPFQLLFLVAFVFGVLEVYYLMKHKEYKKEISAVAKKGFHFDWSVYKHKPFVYFLLCAIFFNFAWQLAWPLFSIYQIKFAHATGFWISIFTVANQIGQIISYKWWGRMTDQHGNAKMLILCALGMATAPFLTILSTDMIYLTVVNLFSGLFLSGTILILFNQLLDVTKENNRSSFIAHYNIVLAIIGFFAPQFGVFLLEATNIEVAMNTSAVLRASSGFVFLLFYLFLKKKNVRSKAVPAS